MEFSYKPVNPFQDDRLSKEDRAMIDAMRNTAYICGYRGGDVEYAIHQALKRIGRYDLLPPCEQESEEMIYTWECKRCGKMIPYMADFCYECSDKILGDPPKPFDQTESEDVK